MKFEPYYDNGEYGAVRLDEEAHTFTIIPLNSMNGKDDMELRSLVLDNCRVWAYPGKPMFNAILNPYGGYEPYNFDIEVGDYAQRFKNVSTRIMCFLEKNFRFDEEAHAPEIITAMILNTYFKDVCVFAPRLIIQGMPGSGKSRLLKAMAKMSYRGWHIPTAATSAAIFHAMGDDDVTPFIDEIQDYDKETRVRIDQIIKGGIEKGSTIPRVRTDKVSGKFSINYYGIYAPIAIVNQSGEYLRNEVLHRSFNLFMMDANDKTIPSILDEEEMAAIRTELYTLRAINTIRPEYIKLNEIFEDTVKHLQSPDGLWPELTGRLRDIGNTTFTMARLMGDTLTFNEVFSKKGEYDSESFTNSQDGEVYNALADIIRDRDEGLDHWVKIGALMRGISTRDIADRINDTRRGNNEYTRYDEMKTSTVTRKLKALGMTITPGKTDNKSMISDTNEKKFCDLMKKYGTNQNKTWLKKRGTS